jgi:hypothetical protein
MSPDVIRMRQTSPCHRKSWLWEVFQGMRIVREVDGRDVYEVRCSECLGPYSLDGGRSKT